MVGDEAGLLVERPPVLGGVQVEPAQPERVGGVERGVEQGAAGAAAPAKGDTP